MRANDGCKNWAISFGLDIAGIYLYGNNLQIHFNPQITLDLHTRDSRSFCSYPLVTINILYLHERFIA